MIHILLNYAFLLFWSIFGEIHRKKFLLDIKVTLSETRTEILRKFFFFLTFLKKANPGEIWICLNKCFWSNHQKEIIIKKKKFLQKVSHILLDYAFLLFWSIFGEIYRELLFLVKKVTISETSTEILWKFVFLTMFERGKSWWKFGFV